MHSNALHDGRQPLYDGRQNFVISANTFVTVATEIWLTLLNSPVLKSCGIECKNFQHTVYAYPVQVEL